jgi:hypothetical protein
MDQPIRRGKPTPVQASWMSEPLTVVVSQARCDEIVEEILENLRPWKRPNAAYPVTPQHQVYDTVHSVAGRSVVQSETRSKNPAIKAYAKEVSKTLAKLESLLKKMPGELRRQVFFESAGFETLWTWEGGSDELFVAFGRVHRLFDNIQKYLYCRPNFDPVKKLCAFSAYSLILIHSKRPATGTVDGPFRVISSLLFEAASGNRDADLKRACDTVLRRHRG